jgi:hypothetical protein
MCPRLTIENVKNIEPMNFEGCSIFEKAVGYFNLFANTINLHISNGDQNLLTPYMKMLAQASSFIDNSADRGRIDNEDCEQIIEAIKWALDQFAPDGYKFENDKYVETA